MKILIVASTMVHIKNFHLPYIEEFKKQGNEVFVMAKGEEADFNIPFKKRSLSLKNFTLSRKIRKIIKKESFDIIYLHTTLAAFWVRMAVKGLKKRPYIVNTVHGYLFGNGKSLKNRIYLACEKILKKQTDKIIVMNKEDFEIAKKNNLCSGEIYFSYGMGINLDNRSVNKQKREDGKIKLVFVGEISKRKNQEFLVRCMTSLPDYTLTLVGDGDESKKLKKLIKSKGLEQRVKITGYTKNVYQYIEKADLYVSASEIEGLPFNIMEAMYAKMPIVASDIKGHRELLPKDCLYDLNDEKAFLNAVSSARLVEREYNLQAYKIGKVLPENMEMYLPDAAKVKI